MNLPENDARVRLRKTDEADDTAQQLLVDDVPVRYGRFQDGVFFVYENAYVWSADLRELGRQLLDDRLHGRIPAAGEQAEGGE